VDPSLWVGDLAGVVGEEFGVPAGRVEEVVVAGALQGQVVEGGRPAVENPTPSELRPTSVIEPTASATFASWVKHA
jgi:hypothetical protein